MSKSNKETNNTKLQIKLLCINTFSHLNILNSNLENFREYELFSYIYFVHVIIDNL
jgi:hypothetical protein